MALFQRMPKSTEPRQYVTVGLNKSVLIVGLGNMGNEYLNSRHNIGFAAVDAFQASQDFPDWIQKKDLKCLFSQTTIDRLRVILIKPATMMNLSGEAVQLAASFYTIPPSQILVIHDELDVNFGQIRTRVGGASAGHNGIKSVIQHVGEQFGRVRIGIGPKKPAAIDSADFVLQKFTKEETSHLPELLRETTAILSEYSFNSASLPNETRSFLL